MIENEAGYRGSKSKLISNVNFVKEQRADGNLYLSIKYIRCTLMGFERNYQLKNLSKLLNKFSTFSIVNDNYKINPYFVTGFCDGESSFNVTVNNNNKLKTNWEVRAQFTIGLHSRDINLLLQLQEFFGCGIIFKNKTQSKISYQVQSIKDLTNKIMPHFDKYPLLTQKAADFLLFKNVIKLMNNQAHLTAEGLQEIINLRASMNLGLSDLQKSAFPNFHLAVRPVINTNKINDANWIAGFTSAEGCFFVDIYNSKTSKIGFKVKLTFSVTQHSRDKKLFELIAKYLNCGVVYTKSENAFVLKVQKFEDLTKKLIPLFAKNKIQGIKQLDYLDFCQVAKLMRAKNHLTIEGLYKIRKIKSGMNKGREN